MKILIAEDEHISRVVLERVLVHMGHEVVTTSNGKEAWARYSREFFPVVITDWMMPEMDGIALAQHIRRARYPEYTWMIMLTSREFKQNHAYSIEAGIDDYLVKPLNREMLRVRLRVASRLCEMTARVRWLESGLPLCIGCKDVREAGNQWANIETYLERHTGIDISHAMCPDCHYKRSLLPDLEIHSKAMAAHKLSVNQAQTMEEPIHTDWFKKLQQYDREQAPGLLQEVLDDFLRVVAQFHDELRTSGAQWVLDPPAQSRFALFRIRCNHIGAFRLGALFAPRYLRQLQRQDQKKTRYLQKIEEEMAHVVNALTERGIYQTAEELPIVQMV